jgi:hypothetical protein
MTINIPIIQNILTHFFFFFQTAVCIGDNDGLKAALSKYEPTIKLLSSRNLIARADGLNPE